jgi:hypothetical protein
MRQVNPRFEVASGEYDRRRAAGIALPGISVVERLFKLRPRQLEYYRANYISRRGRKGYLVFEE